MSDEKCCCGQPLHYLNPTTYDFMEREVARLGPTIKVQVIGEQDRYLVPRHYIALHGLKAWELGELAAKYGWEKL